MKELPVNMIMLYACTILVVMILTPLIGKLPRTQGRHVIWHVLFVTGAIAIIWFVPDWIQDEILSPGGVLVACTVVPVYESIVAACTIESTDDRAWMQYWIISAVFHLATEFIDDIVARLPLAGEHWFEFEFFFTIWLFFPLTDGAGFIYEHWTKPYITPICIKLKRQLEGWASLLLTAVNSGYLWLMWFAFIRLSEEERRFLVIGLGTVYPVVASTVAISNDDETDSRANLNNTVEERFWLTYWPCFMLLFCAMDYLENFIGGVPGFFSLIAACVLYLFLPMFRGSEVVFRRVLVPLTGQYENMLLHDAYLVRRTMEHAIPAESRSRVFTRAAELFLKGKTN